MITQSSVDLHDFEAHRTPSLLYLPAEAQGGRHPGAVPPSGSQHHIGLAEDAREDSIGESEWGSYPRCGVVGLARFRPTFAKIWAGSAQMVLADARTMAVRAN